MFPSSGYFKGVNCPFYSSGLCERPYCHFRHTKNDKESSHGDHSNRVHNGKHQSRKSSLLNLVGNAIKQVQQEIQQDQQQLYGQQTRKRTSSREEGNITKCTYIPTKKSSTSESTANSRINWYKPSVVSTSGKVEYHPTKKEDLNKYVGNKLPVKQQKSPHPVSPGSASGSKGDGYVPSKKKDVPEYNPTPIKQLQTMSRGGTPSPELEYDPSTNYEYSKTTHPATGTKRGLSFDIDGRDSKRLKQVACADEELKQFENIEAKFSDDEDEDFVRDSDTKIAEHQLDKEDKSTDDMENVDDMENYGDAKEPGTKTEDTIQDVVKSDAAATNRKDNKDVFDVKNDRNKDSEQPSEQNLKQPSEQASEPAAEQAGHPGAGDSVQNDLKNNLKNKDSSGQITEGQSEELIKCKDAIPDKKVQNSHDSSSSSKAKEKSHKPSEHKSSHRSHSHSSSNHKSSHSSRSHSSSSSSHRSSHSSHRHSTSSKDKSHKHTSSKPSHSKSKSDGKHSDSHNKDKHLKDKHDDSINKSSSRNSNSSIKPDTSRSTSHSSSSKSKDERDKNSKHSKTKRPSNGDKHKSTTKPKTPTKDGISEEGKSSEKKRSRTVSSDSSKVILFGSDSEDDLSLSDVSVSDVNPAKEDHSLERNKNKQDNNGTKLKVDITASPICTPGNHDDSGDNSDSFLDVPDLYQVYEISSSDEDPYKECLKIYNEASKAAILKANRERKSMLTAASIIKKKEEKIKTEEYSVGKKRMAHQAGLERSNHAKVSAKPYYRPSPAQVMHNRFMQLQKQAEEASAAKTVEASAAKTMSETTLKPSGKRIAHNAASASGSSLQNKKLKSTSGKTSVSTIPKGGKRVARMPTKVASKRPTIPSEYGSKVPVNVRQRYLNLIIDECLKIYETEGEAYSKGLEEESSVYKRSSNRTVYLNVAVNTVKRLRSESSLHQPGTSSQTSNKRTPSKGFSHEAVLGGSRAAKTSFTLNRSGGPVQINERDFKDAGLYKKLSPYILTEEQLVDNGFPRFNPEAPGTPHVKLREDNMNKRLSKIENERICCRCGKRFIVYPNGIYATQEECTYHWGKAWKKRIAGAIETRYTCCQGDLGAAGCQVAKCHVHEQNKYESNCGYMRTIPCSPPIDGDYGVYALDCEMVYTTAGIELARVTVIGGDMKPAYEALVKPEKPVLDCNTRFSGLKDSDLKGVRTTIRDVQAVLLSLFSDKTILMGHSLESDLVSLKLIHSTVVDTSVVFPHKMGPPYKRALKTLMVEYMQKIIQDDVGGHDSKEDAMACLELMLWKLKDDAKKHR